MDQFFAIRSTDATLGTVYAGRRGWRTDDRAATIFSTRAQAEATLAQWRRMAEESDNDRDMAMYAAATVEELQ